MEQLLINAGMSDLQAQVYLYLLENGAAFPTKLTSPLSITRTNAYKVLESLEKLGLVRRETVNKKIRYAAEDPAALTSLIAEKRNAVLALEHNVNTAMQELRHRYSHSRSGTEIKSTTGKTAMAEAYKQQAIEGRPLYFVKSRADVPFMGFDTMHQLRLTQGKLARQRYGITHDSTEAPYNTAIDQKTKLTRTWIEEGDYTAPVEWSVSDNTVLIQIFDGEGRSVSIQDEQIAESFKQVWRLLDKTIRGSDGYEEHPKKAKRIV